jgi:hypothetical protein
MLRRARLRTVPGESPNSAAVSANAGADISACPLRETVRTPLIMGSKLFWDQLRLLLINSFWSISGRSLLRPV